jgi:hypothetical protein
MLNRILDSQFTTSLACTIFCHFLLPGPIFYSCMHRFNFSHFVRAFMSCAVNPPVPLDQIIEAQQLRFIRFFRRRISSLRRLRHTITVLLVDMT